MALWENVIGYGTHAERPAPGAPGALYCESDTGNVVRDNGLGWDVIAGAPISPAFARQDMGDADIVIAQGNTLVTSTGAGHTATLPAVAAAAGLCVILKNKGTSPSTLAAADGEAFEDGRASIPTGGDHGAVVVWSDGTQWCLVSTLYNSADWT